MFEPEDEQTVMRDYLLGTLEMPMREEVEERIVCDSGFAERLAAEEDNLIDDYVFDGLSEANRENFQKNFLFNDERRHKLRVAQAFEVYVASDLSTQNVINRSYWLTSEPWRAAAHYLGKHKVAATLGLATALLLIFLAPKLVTWLLPNTLPPGDEQRARIERELADLNRDPSRWGNSSSTELALQPTILRDGGETRKVVITEDVRYVRLKLESLPVKHDRYRAVIKTVEGRELFVVNELKSEGEPDGALILLRIPSAFLSTGDYKVGLQGITADGASANVATYHFRIIKNNTPQ